MVMSKFATYYVTIDGAIIFRFLYPRTRSQKSSPVAAGDQVRTVMSRKVKCRT